MDGSSTGGVALPRAAFQEIEQLVQRFYQPGEPTTKAAIDAQLKQYQTSNEGWQIADALLNSEDPNVRYFAILTFQVKIQLDGFKLDAQTAESVLLRLIHWLIQLDRNSSSALVIQKLCSTLGTFLVKSSILWARPLVQTAVSFLQGQSVAEDDLPSISDAAAKFPELTLTQLRSLLWLSSALALEGSRLSTNTPAGAMVLNQMKSITEEYVILLDSCLSHSQAEDLMTWILTSFRSFADFSEPWLVSQEKGAIALQNLVPRLVPYLTRSSTRLDALEIFRDILENVPRFLNTHMELLLQVIDDTYTPQAISGIQRLDPETMPVVQFVAAWALANVEKIVEHPNTRLGSVSIVQILMIALKAPDYPGREDQISVLTLEWWGAYLEHASNLKNSESPEDIASWIHQVESVCYELCSTLSQKMCWPSSAALEDWDKEERVEFETFRRDAVQLIPTVYTILDDRLLVHLNQRVTHSLETGHWDELEVTLFCINSLADYVDASNSALKQLFQTEIFARLASSGQDIPERTKRTAVATLSSFSTTISQNTNQIPNTIRFLVGSLDDASLVDVGAKAMEQLCSACRKHLTSEVSGFLEQYRRLAANSNLDPYASKKYLSGVAAIIQAITPEGAQAPPLSALLDIVNEGVEAAQNFVQHGDQAQGKLLGEAAVDYLAGIGKSLQDPSEETVIDGDETPVSNQISYWTSAEGQAIQFRILQTSLAVIRLLPTSEEVVKSVCEIFKSGSSEDRPGPFVFSADITIQFIEECQPPMPDLASVVSLAQNMLLNLARKKDVSSTSHLAQRIIDKIISIIATQSSPTADPLLSNACLEACKRALNIYPSLLLDVSSTTGTKLKTILDFALISSDCPEPFPKRSAALFWTDLVQHTRPTGSPDPTDIALNNRAIEAVTAYGPMLVHRLVNLITGAAQRSELQYVAEPLRALLNTRVETRNWIEQVFLHAPLSTKITHVTEAERKRFVASMASTCGSLRPFREVIIMVYAVCRGTVVNFSAGK